MAEEIKPSARDFDSLQALVKENIELTKNLQADIKKINRYIAWQRVFSVFKVLIIVIPVVLGIIYLPKIVSDLISPYQNVLKNLNSSSGINLENLYGF